MLSGLLLVPAGGEPLSELVRVKVSSVDVRFVTSRTKAALADERLTTMPMHRIIDVVTGFVIVPPWRWSIEIEWRRLLSHRGLDAACGSSIKIGSSRGGDAKFVLIINDYK